MFKKIISIYYKHRYGYTASKAYEIFGGRVVSVTKSPKKISVHLHTHCGNEMEYVENTKD